MREREIPWWVCATNKQEQKFTPANETVWLNDVFRRRRNDKYLLMIIDMIDLDLLLLLLLLSMFWIERSFRGKRREALLNISLTRSLACALVMYRDWWWWHRHRCWCGRHIPWGAALSFSSSHTDHIGRWWCMINSVVAVVIVSRFYTSLSKFKGSKTSWCTITKIMSQKEKERGELKTYWWRWQRHQWVRKKIVINYCL